MVDNVLSSKNVFVKERFIGRLQAVSLAVFEVVVYDTEAKVSVDDYVIVQSDDVGIFGRITNLDTKTIKDPEGKDITVTVGVLIPSSSINLKTRNISTGVLRVPSMGAYVFLATEELIEKVLNPVDTSDSDLDVLLNFCSLVKSNKKQVSVTPEMFFGRHCTVLGTTGSGKSWSLASIIQECTKHNCKAVLLDPSGEYASLKEGVKSIYLGEDLTPSSTFSSDAIEVSLPYYDLKETDLFSIFTPSGETQGPKLRQAMKTLKLLRLDPSVGIDGLVFKANKSKQQFEEAYEYYYNSIEDPYCDFDISKLTAQINNECVFPSRSDLEPFIWGDYNGMEQARVVPLINRISQIIGSKELECIFNPGQRPSLLGELEEFLRDPTQKVLRISLQYLSFAYNTREIVANAVGRYLLEGARDGRFMHQPLIVFVDEGHQFLNEALSEKKSDYPLDAFALIAKEGRKYGLTICLATQRPRDIPEGVLSQMGSFLVHRVINDGDRYVIERAAGQADQATMSVLPILSAGEAILLGIEFKAPLHVQVNIPEDKPISTGPSFQKCWKKR